MGVVLAGLGETATFQAGTCSTEGPVGRGAKTPSQVIPSRDHRKGQRGQGKVPDS